MIAVSCLVLSSDTYQSNMCKQAMGQSSSDVSSQVDTNSHLLCYPSMPLVKTMTLNWLRAEQYSAGTMLRSLVACYDGFNQGRGNTRAHASRALVSPFHPTPFALRALYVPTRGYRWLAA
jgi:hypothetical protein